MSGYHGDIRLGDTIDLKFTTVSTAGVPTTLAGTPVISAYPGNSTTELTAGITLSVDFDSRTGMHNVRVVATSGNGYATATNYVLAITTGTVGGGSVVGYEIGSFSIENRSALMPTTATRTLDVASTGEAGLDFDNMAYTGNGPKPLFGLIDNGTAQAATATTLQLRAAAAFANSEIIGATIKILTATTGAGQSRVITAYVGATDTATVDAWTTTPTGTIVYEVYGTAPNNLAAMIAADPTIVKLAAMINGTPAFTAPALALGPSGTGYDPILATGTATSAGSTNSFIDSAKIGQATNWMKGNRIKWISGTAANVGMSVKILSFVSATGAFTTSPMNASPASSDAYKIIEAADEVLANVTHTARITNVTLADTITNYTGNEPQTADAAVLIGAAGASLTALASQSSVDTIDNLLDTEIGAIKAKTDQLTFTKSDELDVNVQSVNGTTVNGSGTELNPWSP